MAVVRGGAPMPKSRAPIDSALGNTSPATHKNRVGFEKRASSGRASAGGCMKDSVNGRRSSPSQRERKDTPNELKIAEWRAFSALRIRCRNRANLRDVSRRDD